ncbi:MAG: dienelactone hydrolase family protein [Acidimicrobiia bacterium]|nr:dienelactone hydrolase family protein [Acidimicrobiia bacterium]
MTDPDVTDPDRVVLPGFRCTAETFHGTTRTVYRKGTGPAVVILHEIPGITPEVAAFGERVAAEGFTAVLPSLFGEPGRPLGITYAARTYLSLCVSREFTMLATGRSSPVTTWIRALVRAAHDECGGPGVGVVGMCATGGFALAVAVEPSVLAPVMSQPASPIPIGRTRRRGLDTDDADLARIRERVADDGLCVMGLRFTGDPLVPAERFDRLREEFGDGFIAVEIDSSRGNAHDIKRIAHSVLTNDLVDEPGHPTRDALDEVLQLFRNRLLDDGEPAG